MHLQIGGVMSSTSFIKIFDGIAKHNHRYTIFSDFVTLSAISLHNAVNKLDHLEAEYMEIIGKYTKDEANSFSKLLAELINMLEEEPKDVLCGLYMELNLSNNKTGQFFTPNHISELMAKISYDDDLRELKKPFISLSEPACGAGRMVLAFTKVMLSHNHNPAERLWVQCVDVDRIAALMCYIQLPLWNIPAQVYVGNTLTLEFRERFFTPAHYLYGQREKLLFEKVADLSTNKAKTDALNETLQDGDQQLTKPQVKNPSDQLNLF
jgi:type I restriction-modification system DNA methylase subunit